MVIDTVPVLDRDFPGSSVVKSLPAIARNLGDVGSILGLGRSPGGGNANPFHYTCVKSLMYRKLAGFQGVAKESDTIVAEHAPPLY